MTRATQQLSIGVLIATIYTVAALGYVPLPSILSDEIIPYLPFWTLVSFGAFLLFKLGYGVLTFNDVPEAHEELMKQIAVARADLQKRGVEVD